MSSATALQRRCLFFCYRDTRASFTHWGHRLTAPLPGAPWGSHSESLQASSYRSAPRKGLPTRPLRGASHTLLSTELTPASFSSLLMALKFYGELFVKNPQLPVRLLASVTVNILSAFPTTSNACRKASIKKASKKRSIK